jgi:Bacteriocin-protection, YdeI or OmpD-Associated/Domain of unknown function (DUF1905)
MKPAGTVRTLVQLERSDNSGSTCFFEIPPATLAKLGPEKRMKLVVTLKGVAYPATVAVYDGRFYVPVRADIRAAAGGIEPGHRVRVELRRDDSERTVVVPEDLARALDAAGLRDSFEAFALSHRKEWVAAVEQAKRAETRASRIEKTLAMLRAKGPPRARGVRATATAKTPAPRSRRTF